MTAGHIPGGQGYGGDILHTCVERGLRVINADEAEVVWRNYKDHVGGQSAVAIVVDLNLNQRHIAGSAWRHLSVSASIGSPNRLIGQHSNELYRGTVVHKPQRFIKEPATGKRVAWQNPRVMRAGDP